MSSSDESTSNENFQVNQTDMNDTLNEVDRSPNHRLPAKSGKAMQYEFIKTFANKKAAGVCRKF